MVSDFIIMMVLTLISKQSLLIDYCLSLGRLGKIMCVLCVVWC